MKVPIPTTALCSREQLLSTPCIPLTVRDPHRKQRYSSTQTHILTWAHRQVSWCSSALQRSSVTSSTLVTASLSFTIIPGTTQSTTAAPLSQSPDSLYSQNLWIINTICLSLDNLLLNSWTINDFKNCNL